MCSGSDGWIEAREVAGPARLCRDPLEPSAGQRVCSWLLRACPDSRVQMAEAERVAVQPPRPLGSLRGGTRLHQGLMCLRWWVAGGWPWLSPSLPKGPTPLLFYKMFWMTAGGAPGS